MNPAYIKTLLVVGLITSAFFANAQKTTTSVTDEIQLGIATSEKNHQLSAPLSDTIMGGLKEPARRLLPLTDKSWKGGTMAFSMKVDPVRQNYFTIKLWGSESNPNRLVLFCEGKQVGYLHLGDIDLLDIGDHAPGYNGRFYYKTTALPVAATQGKSSIHFEIRSIGPIWGYGTYFEQYQKMMDVPTRGIYKVYTHTEGYFTPGQDEQQGSVENATIRKGPGPEIMDQVKERVNKETNNILHSKKPISQQQMEFIAKASLVKWTTAYQNKEVVRLVVEGADNYFRRYRKNPKLAITDPGQYNADWFGIGPMADAFRVLKAELQPYLDINIADSAGKVQTRRQAWSEMLLASRDHLRMHRPHYTNQTMIQDLNIYLSNKGLEAIDPAKAMTEEEARRYIYEAIGIQPWLGSDTQNGPSKPLGDNYYQLTAKGLTKELGYVGYYGEILDWVTHIYLATAEPGKPSTGDEKIKAQLIKLEHARAVFRYPTLDDEGNKAMRIETIIGWRDSYYPGDVTYAERPSWEGSAIYSVAASLDPLSIGFVQQMYNDNQFYSSVQHMMESGGLRVTKNLLNLPDNYETLKVQPIQAYQLPMSWGQPDFVFTDEEDGVLTLKNKNELLYISLYWRARYGINNLARVHYITPTYDRIAVVKQETGYTPSGMEYKRPDWVNFGFGNGGLKYPGELHSANAGEKMDIAKIPDGIKFRPGDENIHAGKGDFYKLGYGKYFIAMNMSKDKAFSFDVPENYKNATDLVTGKKLGIDKSINVPAQTTVVLYKPD